MKKTKKETTAKPQGEYRELPLADVFPNPDQPRKHFDPVKLEELAQSIREQGVQQPIKVTPRNGGFMIVMGERRYRASLLAEKKTIPAIIEKMTALKVEELALLENIQRQDLNIIEEAKAFASLLEKHPLEELAKRLGYKRPGAILDRTQLLHLAPEFQELVIKDKLSPTEAYWMSRLPVEKQHLVFGKIQRGELASAKKLFAYVQGLMNIEAQEEIFALAPLSEDERKSINDFSSLIASVERFIKRVQKDEGYRHLEKVVFHSDISPERLDYIISRLQKIRKLILVGDGVKKAMHEAA